MEVRIDVVSLHYVDRGSGVPLVALHGVGVDHREIEAALGAVAPPGVRLICPDLPAMGQSTAGGLGRNDDVVRVIAGFVEHLDAGPVLLLGHSYGAYLARGVAAQRSDLVRGLALVCPVAERSGAVPEHLVLREEAEAYEHLDESLRVGFDEYFVVRTPATALRYRDHVVPGTLLVDQNALGWIFTGWAVDVGHDPYPGPTSIIAGRDDSTVGYADAVALLERYPNATLAVVGGAGHALMHERPEVFRALVAEWIERAAQAT